MTSTSFGVIVNRQASIKESSKTVKINTGKTVLFHSLGAFEGSELNTSGYTINRSKMSPAKALAQSIDL